MILLAQMDDPRIRKYDIIGYSFTLIMCVVVFLCMIVDFSFLKASAIKDVISVDLIENERFIAPVNDAKQALKYETTTYDGEQHQEISENDFLSKAKLPLEKIDFEIIKRKIFANLIFPPLAKQNGWSGTVQVALTINEMGQLVSAKINQTSGKKIFDDVVLMATEKLKFDSLPKPSVTSTLLFDIEFTR